jgi:hypothetical protein
MSDYVEVIPRHVFSREESSEGGKASGVARRVKSSLQRGDLSYFEEIRDRHGKRFAIEALNVLRASMGELEGVCPDCGGVLEIRRSELTAQALNAAKAILKYFAEEPSSKVERVIHAEEFGQIALASALQVYGKEKLEEFATVLAEKLRTA